MTSDKIITFKGSGIERTTIFENFWDCSLLSHVFVTSRFVIFSFDKICSAISTNIHNLKYPRHIPIILLLKKITDFYDYLLSRGNYVFGKQNYVFYTIIMFFYISTVNRTKETNKQKEYKKIVLSKERERVHFNIFHWGIKYSYTGVSFRCFFFFFKFIFVYVYSFKNWNGKLVFITYILILSSIFPNLDYRKIIFKNF